MPGLSFSQTLSLSSPWVCHSCLKTSHRRTSPVLVLSHPTLHCWELQQCLHCCKQCLWHKRPSFPRDTHKLPLIHNYHSNCYSQRIRNFSFHPKINLTSIFVCHLSRSSYAPFSSNHGTQFLYPNNSCLSNASIMLSDAHTYPTRQNRVLPPSHYLLTFFLGFLSSDFLVLSFPLLLPSNSHPPRPSSTDP